MVEDTLLSRRSQSMQNRSVSSESDDTCITFCCSPCLGLYYLLCLGSLKISTRLKIVWIWMISLSLFGGLYIRYNLYNTDAVSITSYDMMPVQKMSTFFCQGVSIQSESIHTPLKVYRLNNKPQINYTRTIYSMSHRFNLYFIQEKMVNFYLLEGSSVTLFICAKYSFTVDVIQGTKNYNNFKLSKESNAKPWKFPGKCSTKTFDVIITDRYYFILNNINTHIIELKLVLHKTTFALDKRESKLINENWHTFVPLEFNSQQSVVYQPVLENYQDLNITSSCHPLILIYTAIFFGGSFSLGLILCYLVKCICKDPTPEPPPPPPSFADPAGNTSLPPFQTHPTAPLPHQGSENSWFVRNPHLPTCPPPSYDSLFANSANDAPPSYMSATIELNGK